MTTVEQVERLYAAVMEDAEKGDWVASLFLKHCDPYEWLSEEERERARVMREKAIDEEITIEDDVPLKEDYAHLHREEVAMRKAKQRKRKKYREKNRKAKQRQLKEEKEKKRLARAKVEKRNMEKKKSKRATRSTHRDVAKDVKKMINKISNGFDIE